MKATVTTQVNGKKYYFSFNIHCSMDRAEHRIEPEFYLQKSIAKQLPEGTHHEVEILEHKYFDHPHWEKVHEYLSAKDQKKYICWTGQIRTRDRLAFMVRMWCIGTTYTLETGEDFAICFEKFNVQSEDFLGMEKVLKDKYGITIPASRFDFLN